MEKITLILFLLISSLQLLQVSAYVGILAPKREVACDVQQIAQPSKHLQGLRGRQLRDLENVRAARHDGARGGSRGGGPGLVRPKSKGNGASLRLPLSPSAIIFVQVTVGLLLQVFL